MSRHGVPAPLGPSSWGAAPAGGAEHCSSSAWEQSCWAGETQHLQASKTVGTDTDSPPPTL